MLSLEKALVNGVIRYSAPVLHSASSSSKKKLQTVQNIALRLCLGIPHGASGSGTVAESGSKTVSVMIAEESLRIHLRHATQHRKHFLATISRTRPSSRFGAFIGELRLRVPSPTLNSSAPFPPFWTLPTLNVVPDIPGMEPKNQSPQPVRLQVALDHLFNIYRNTVQLYTDGSTTATSSASAFVVPETQMMHIQHLSHQTSSTAAELQGLLSAVRYVSSQDPPQRWVILTDSLAALRDISLIGRKGAN